MMGVGVQNLEGSREIWNEFRILDEIAKDENVSQRGLAEKVGIAVGHTNQIMRRLITKGMVKTRRINAKRVAYLLTPMGFTEKLRLVMGYTERTIGFFSTVRGLADQSLDILQRECGIQTVAMVGTGELAEVLYLSIQHHGLTLSAVYAVDGDGVGQPWLGMTVRALADAPADEADLAVVAEMELTQPPMETVQTLGRQVLDMRQLLSKNLAHYAKDMEHDIELLVETDSRKSPGGDHAAGE